MSVHRDVVALVTARGGSKGVPGKNIRPIAGKPLIAWSIEHAHAANSINRVIVSTDDESIADVARSCGAEVPFMRPAALATDDATSEDVVFHALDWLADRAESPRLLVLVEPTSPLRRSFDLDAAVRLIDSLPKAGAVVGVCEAEHHPAWMGPLEDDGRMASFAISSTSRHELDVVFRLNGAVYVAHPDYVRKSNGFYGERTYAYVMPRDRSVDINDEVDFALAEILLRRRMDLT